MKYLLISLLLLASCIIEKQEDSDEPKNKAETPSSSVELPNNLFSSSSSKIEFPSSSSTYIDIPESPVDTFVCQYSWQVCSSLWKNGGWKNGDLAANYQTLCDTFVLSDLMKKLPYSKIHIRGEYNSNGNLYIAGQDSVIINHENKSIKLYDSEYTSSDAIRGAEVVCLKSGKYEEYSIYTYVDLTVDSPYPIQN